MLRTKLFQSRDWWASRDNERLSIWNGSFSMVSMSIVNGFIGMYLLDGLHANDNEMGLQNSLPSLVNLFSMMLAALLIPRVKSKKWFCVISSSISRTFYLWIAVVAFLPVKDVALWVVWLVALTRVPQSAGDLSWQALIAELIPPDRRSPFFSERNRVLTIVGLVATFGGGLVLQQFNKHLIWPYQMLFFSTAIFAFFELWLLIRHDESKAFVETSLPDLDKIIPHKQQRLRQLLADKRFVFVALALLFFNFGWQLSWPLFSIYQITTAHASAMWMAMFSVASNTTQVLTFRWWGRMSERFGNGRVLAFAAAGMSLTPFLTILSTNMWYLFAMNLVTGIPLAGTNLLLFNYLLEVCPPKERTSYIAYYNVALSVVGFLAPEVGILLLHQIGMTGGMLTSGILRVAGGGLFFLVALKWTGKKAAGAATIPL